MLLQFDIQPEQEVLASNVSEACLRLLRSCACWVYVFLARALCFWSPHVVLKEVETSTIFWAVNLCCDPKCGYRSPTCTGHGSNTTLIYPKAEIRYPQVKDLHHALVLAASERALAASRRELSARPHVAAQP